MLLIVDTLFPWQPTQLLGQKNTELTEIIIAKYLIMLVLIIYFVTSNQILYNVLDVAKKQVYMIILCVVETLYL